MMLSSLIAPLLFFQAVASPIASIDNCTVFPSWTITNFKSNTTDSVGTVGSASFKLTNNLSGGSDELTCTLQANYRCTIAGTPSDQNLTINVAIRASWLTFLLDKAVECPGRTAYA